MRMRAKVDKPQALIEQLNIQVNELQTILIEVKQRVYFLIE